MKGKTAGIENEVPQVGKSRSKSGDNNINRKLSQPTSQPTELASEAAENYNYDFTSDDYNFMSYRHEDPAYLMTMKTDTEKRGATKTTEPQLFKEVDQNIMEYK